MNIIGPSSVRAIQGRRDSTRVHRDLVRRLTQQIRAIEQTSADHAPGRCSCQPVATGWGDVDRALSGNTRARQGLLRGAIHEWCGVADPWTNPGATRCADCHRKAVSTERPRCGRWAPPLCLLSHLAWQALLQKGLQPRGGYVLWIGRPCWPHPRVLIRDDEHGRCLLTRSIFVDPPDAACRLWTIDLVLRSSAVTAVVADSSGLDMAATRRLQLAAEAGRTLALLARPPHELSELSAAATRWLVRASCVRPHSGTPFEGSSAPGFPQRRAGSDIFHHRWIIELRRCKSQQTVSHAAGRWTLEWHRGNHAVVVSSDLVDRPDCASLAPDGYGAANTSKTA